MEENATRFTETIASSLEPSDAIVSMSKDGYRLLLRPAAQTDGPVTGIVYHHPSNTLGIEMGQGNPTRHWQVAMKAAKELDIQRVIGKDIPPCGSYITLERNATGWKTYHNPLEEIEIPTFITRRT